MFKRFFKRKKNKVEKIDNNISPEQNNVKEETTDFESAIVSEIPKEMAYDYSNSIENIKDEFAAKRDHIKADNLLKVEMDVPKDEVGSKLNSEIEHKEYEYNIESSYKSEIACDLDSLNEELKNIKEDKGYKIADNIYILEAKLKRGKGIKARDLYTDEEQIFKTHKECSRKLKLPLGYIKENLKYGYTDYIGESINFITKELNPSIENFDEFAYIYNSKSPMEQYNILNDKIFKSRISESKRDEILSSNKIEPIKMHYTFESIDTEYDDYFQKYKSILQRGGKKKVELVDKNDKAIDIFKSVDDCALYLDKSREEVIEMLKLGNTKAGRYHIRYSLRNI